MSSFDQNPERQVVVQAAGRRKRGRRLDYIYDTIVDICKEAQVACNSYREVFHPHFPEGKFLTALKE